MIIIIVEQDDFFEQEPYEFKVAKQVPYEIDIFKRRIKIPFLKKVIVEEVDEEEESDRMLDLKIRILNDKIEEERNYQIKIVNYQENNIYKAIGGFLCNAIFCLIIFIIEQYAHITQYVLLKNISLTDLRSVGSLFFIPIVLVLIVAIIICTGWQILLIKRTFVIEDPHDHINKDYETVLKRSRERIMGYERKIEELQRKKLHIK